MLKNMQEDPQSLVTSKSAISCLKELRENYILFRVEWGSHFEIICAEITGFSTSDEGISVVTINKEKFNGSLKILGISKIKEQLYLVTEKDKTPKKGFEITSTSFKITEILL